jgi:hypothetical protein
VRCESCGLEELAMKTVRPRSGGVFLVLCDPCYGPRAGEVWVVAGRVIVHGKCRSCGHWFSLRELAGISPGGKWDAPSGLCSGCASTTP